MRGMMTAAEALGQALLEIAEQRRATPCQGRRRDRWTSESAEDRAWAATVCVGLNCEVLPECAAAAAEQGEKFGVWAGADRTPLKKPRTRRAGSRLMPRRNRISRPWTRRTRAPELAPPEPTPTPERLAKQLVARGLAHPRILEVSEAYTPTRRNPDAQP